jgi:hypothetical protein
MKTDNPQETLQMLDAMYENESLSPEFYRQCLVTLASEYLIHHQDPGACLELLNRCGPDYYRNQILEQLKTDQLFVESTVELVYRLQQLGLTDDDGSPNQKPAEA